MDWMGERTSPPDHFDQQTNDAVISLQQVMKPSTSMVIDSNVSISNLRIDTPVGRLIGMLINNSAAVGFPGGVPVRVQGVFISNVTITKPFAWSVPGNTPSQFLIVCQMNSWIEEVYFTNIVYNGKLKTCAEIGGFRKAVVFGNATELRYSPGRG